jgi:hypothetical protein
VDITSLLKTIACSTLFGISLIVSNLGGFYQIRCNEFCSRVIFPTIIVKELKGVLAWKRLLVKPMFLKGYVL